MIPQFNAADFWFGICILMASAVCLGTLAAWFIRGTLRIGWAMVKELMSPSPKPKAVPPDQK